MQNKQPVAWWAGALFIALSVATVCLTLAVSRRYSRPQDRPAPVVSAPVAPLRPLLPAPEMLVPEYGHPSEQPAPAVKILPRPCKAVTMEAVRDINQGYTLINALLWLLSSTNLGQRQNAYHLLDGVTGERVLHGECDLTIHTLYKIVLCGDQWEIVARNIIHDALTNPEMSAGGKRRARGALAHFEIQDALPILEKHMSESTDQLEIIQLARLWLDIKLGPAWQAESNKARAKELFAELVRKIPRLRQFSVAERAIAFYGELLQQEGCLCPPQELIRYELEDAPPPPALVQEKLFFLDPESTCPPPPTLQEMQLQQCPFKTS